MVSLSNSSPGQAHDNSPFVPSNNPTICLEIRTARVADARDLSEVLAASFYSPRGLMFWLYPLLRLGICEDLRARLKSSVPYYSCLSAIAVVDTPLTQPTIPDTTQTREIAGTVEIALREREGLNECALRKEHPHSVKSQGENEGNYLYISNLAVSPAYRRQGIARKLLLSCEPLARQWGYREIYLHVLENNDRAKQLYFNLGYDINRIEPQKNNWIWPHPKCLLLRKSLAVR